MKELLDMNRIPQHIAIIMDGNGRWAMERGKDRSFGHQAGVDAVRRITSECTRLGVKFLTLYTKNLQKIKKIQVMLVQILIQKLLKNIQ